VNQPTAIVPGAALIDPHLLAGATAAIIAALLLLLYSYRRRLFILWWIASWLLVSVSMLLLAHRFTMPQISWMAYGVSQLVSILSALALVIAADAYRHRTRFRRSYGLALLPVVLWFSLAPAVGGPRLAFAPGHVLAAGALIAAGTAHLLLVRQVRLAGALVIGVALLALAAINLWIAALVPDPGAAAASSPIVVESAIFLAAALGMQLMTFEDMTYELRRTNRRLESAQSELRQLAITDALTGCRNRRFFDEVIGRELQRHDRGHAPMSIIFIDVDRFKVINDTLGHETGDRVLRAVASFLLRNIREADYVFRWGGDEFLVLISCGEAEARARAAALQEAFATSAQSLGLPPGIALSVGCVQVPQGTKDVLPMIQSADERMYVNKKRRR
jgi:diguanylate cyclase (GGDEF)-like protein